MMMMMMMMIDWEKNFKFFFFLGVDEWVFCWRCWCWCWCLVLILDMEFYNIGSFTFFFLGMVYGLVWIWFGMVWLVSNVLGVRLDYKKRWSMTFVCGLVRVERKD